MGRKVGLCVGDLMVVVLLVVLKPKSMIDLSVSVV